MTCNMYRCCPDGSLIWYCPNSSPTQNHIFSSRKVRDSYSCLQSTTAVTGIYLSSPFQDTATVIRSVRPNFIIYFFLIFTSHTVLQVFGWSSWLVGGAGGGGGAPLPTSMVRGMLMSQIHVCYAYNHSIWPVGDNLCKTGPSLYRDPFVWDPQRGVLSRVAVKN